MTKANRPPNLYGKHELSDLTWQCKSAMTTLGIPSSSTNFPGSPVQIHFGHHLLTASWCKILTTMAVPHSAMVTLLEPPGSDNDDNKNTMRRNDRRAHKACLLCRQIHKRCDGTRPCQTCIWRGRARECVDDSKAVRAELHKGTTHSGSACVCFLTSHGSWVGLVRGVQEEEGQVRHATTMCVPFPPSRSPDPPLYTRYSLGSTNVLHAPSATCTSPLPFPPYFQNQQVVKEYQS
eukprot:2800605-Rhodomonas_salina.1